jgi:hypothetical protein
MQNQMNRPNQITWPNSVALMFTPVSLPAPRARYFGSLSMSGLA